MEQEANNSLSMLDAPSSMILLNTLKQPSQKFNLIATLQD
jgi:hypothetical protein